MSHIIKIEAKSNTFILSNLNFIFQFFVKIRMPHSARIIKMRLNQCVAKEPPGTRSQKVIFFFEPRVNFLYSFVSHWFTRHCLIKYTTKISDLGDLLGK